MKHLLKITLLLLVTPLSGVVFAGPKVVPHPKVGVVTIRDSKFTIVQEIKEPDGIKFVQNVFLRAKKVGDTKTHLKKPTHTIDFSDRWLVDLDSGEVSVLSKANVTVYRIKVKDLEVLNKIINNKE